MKKGFLYGVMFLFISISTFAQDQLFKKDNSKLDVKILEINPTQVKYKLKANPDGPTYVVSKSDVALIIYQNGDHEAFKEEAQPQVQTQQPIYVQAPQSRYSNLDSVIAQRNRQKAKEFEEVTKGNNVIFYNMAELVNSGVGISYFRELAKNLLDIHVPFSFSIGEPYGHNLISSGIYNNYNVTNYKTTQKAFDIGLGIYVNTSGKRAVTHFFGPLFRIAQYNGLFQSVDYQVQGTDPWGNPTTNNVYGTHGFVYNECYFMLNNGFLFRITPHFNIMINGAFGIVTAKSYIANDPAGFQTINNYYNNYAPYTNNVAGPTVQFGFHMGYRF